MATFTAYPTADAMWVSSTWDSAGTNILNGNSAGARNAVFGFANVTVPKNATISSAILNTNIYSGSGTGTLALRFCLEDADNPAFPTSAADANGRTLTTAYADYSAARPASGTGSYDWPDFAASVQEVVDRSGWASGNYMNVFSKDNGSSAGTATRYYSVDQTGTSQDPYITINYTDPPAAGALPFLRRRTRTFQRSF